jgi:ribonucleoside-triphosphate reductase
MTISPTLTVCMDCGQKYFGEDAKNIHTCSACGSDDLSTSSRVIGYTKMISRKNIKVDEKGQYNGEYNFWSGAKRIDWNERLRIDESIINEALNISFKDNK